jgi:hypothetical protein
LSQRLNDLLVPVAAHLLLGLEGGFKLFLLLPDPLKFRLDLIVGVAEARGPLLGILGGLFPFYASEVTKTSASQDS